MQYTHRYEIIPWRVVFEYDAEQTIAQVAKNQGVLENEVKYLGSISELDSVYTKYQMPTEMRRFIEAQAYDRGHSAGQDEVDALAIGIAHDLGPHLVEMMARLRKEWTTT